MFLKLRPDSGAAAHIGFVSWHFQSALFTKSLIKQAVKSLCSSENTSMLLWPTFLTVPQDSKHMATGPAEHQQFLQLMLPQFGNNPNKHLMLWLVAEDQRLILKHPASCWLTPHWAQQTGYEICGRINVFVCVPQWEHVTFNLPSYPAELHTLVSGVYLFKDK